MNKFYHDDHTQQIFDARNEPCSDILASSAFYLVYQVKIGHAIWYHHTWLLADDIGEFLTGSNNLQIQIRDRIHPSALVSLLFVRNQYAEDDKIVVSAFGQNIYKDIANHLASGRETNDEFLVFGLIGDEQSLYRMTLMSVNKTDASSAIERVNAHVLNNMHEPFSPLNVCLIHPVTQEFVTRYQSTSSRIRTMIGQPYEEALALQ